MTHSHGKDLALLRDQIKAWGKELGFQDVGIAGIDLSGMHDGLAQWLGRGFHGQMNYMARHRELRVRPECLVPGTLSVICARMDYLPASADAQTVLRDGTKAYLARYALGRDYHRVLRSRLRRLARRIENEVGRFQYRVFTDSAPVMEVALATAAGIGWRGKHTLLLSRDAGSFFFLGEIYTDLPLPVDAPTAPHCGRCRRCMDVCPTGALVEPYRLDARRCISYLTIELKGSIPEEFRALIGNRVYGCDDCQIYCPWNRFAKTSTEPDFQVRNGLDASDLVELFAWTEGQFNQRMAGSAIFRIGYERWMRNLAVGLGNAPASRKIIDALLTKLDDPSALIREHVAWALRRHQSTSAVRGRGTLGPDTPEPT